VYGAGYPVSISTDSYTWQLSYPSSTTIKMCVSRPGAGSPVGTWGDVNLKLTYTVSYTKCSVGQYINSNQLCAPCPAGYFGSSIPLLSPMCSGPCASGTYSTLGSTSCSLQCPLGQYKSGGSCLSCSGSQVVSVDSTGCVSSCPAGQYNNSGTDILCYQYHACLKTLILHYRQALVRTAWTIALLVLATAALSARHRLQRTVCRLRMCALWLDRMKPPVEPTLSVLTMTLMCPTLLFPCLSVRLGL
jgi:hypothetical protein